MPLSSKGRTIMASMKQQYGDKAKQVFFASRNKGVISGVEKKVSALKERALKPFTRYGGDYKDQPVKERIKRVFKGGLRNT